MRHRTRHPTHHHAASRAFALGTIPGHATHGLERPYHVDGPCTPGPHSQLPQPTVAGRLGDCYERWMLARKDLGSNPTNPAT